MIKIAFSRDRTWRLLACLALGGVYFLFVARHRLIDADEGFYLLAAKLVAQGKLPYRDFFFQQMPGLPYVYGVWMAFAGVSWLSARALSGIFSIALGVLLYRHIAALYQRPSLALAAAFLYASNSMIFAWHTVAKTYAQTNLLLFGSYLLASGRQGVPTISRCLLSGFLLALAIDTRLYILAIAPVLLLWIAYSAGRSGCARRCALAFLFGLVLGLLPNLIFLVKSAGPYVFDNLGYHLIRDSTPLLANLKQKLGVLLLLANLQSSYDGLGGQFALLSVPVLLLALLRPVERTLLLPFFMTLALVLVCVLPSPTFTQYFCACVPYMIVISCGVSKRLQEACQAAPDHSFSAILKGMTVLFLGVYCCYGVLAMEQYVFSGRGVAGVETRENAASFRISAVRQVSAEIRRLAAGNEPVASFWPGYLLECDCPPVGGLENQFGVAVSYRLSRAETEKYRLLSLQGISELFENQAPKLAILGNSDYWGTEGRYREIVIQNGYRLVSRAGRTEIYTRRGGGEKN